MRKESRKQFSYSTSDESWKRIYEEEEYRANKYNEVCLLVLAVLMVICVALNEIGIFIVDRYTMYLGCGIGILYFSMPKIVSLFIKVVTKGKSTPEREAWFKYFIIIFSFMGVLVANVLLTHHTILLLAVPMFNMAQYKNIKKLIPLAFILSTACVLAGVYGGYFYGLLDSNLVTMKYADSKAALDYGMRMRMATPVRMQELLYHYALPREIFMIAFLILSTATTMRNNRIIVKQASLQKEVENEMQHTNAMQKTLIEGMANLIECRDLDTGEHVKRTSYYVSIIVDEMKRKKIITEEEAENIVKAAPLHDIGKIVIPDTILQKPGKLTDEEYEIIKTHSPEGKNAVNSIFGNIDDDEFLQIAAQIAGYHHERWDGKGYPEKLAMEEIPLCARIMAVADVFDALVSKRVYKNSFPTEKAFEILIEGSGTQFDPEIVDIFLNNRKKIEDYVHSGIK